ACFPPSPKQLADICWAIFQLDPLGFATYKKPYSFPVDKPHFLQVKRQNRNLRLGIEDILQSRQIALPDLTAEGNDCEAIVIESSNLQHAIVLGNSMAIGNRLKAHALMGFDGSRYSENHELRDFGCEREEVTR